ncbi:LysR family transcriptional regulator [Rhodoferax saidenbachensis]|uniref:LysR family transcriptional regulator n=1 Tax=Rhodoferax saidenbachensis TaxID=1484693 RepID=A0A1P8K5B6_9BURK|nr:LysR family transcriptional regulator [Rhodoferax saidenbachensis]APW41214.1 LysR family transcriptional regulator [Rhodoferax saidenbachensis]
MTTDNTTEIGWELYRSYLGVLEEGSLSGAARAMGIAQPTVGRHVDALEKALGVTLFTRSQTGLLPTEAALALQPFAQAMSSSAAALKRAAESQGSGIKGTVRVTASEVIGQEVLPPILAQLQDAHPGLKVELVLTSRVQDLLQREADIAVRMTQPKQEQLIARHIGAVRLGLHAHKDYLHKHGTPASLADLPKYALIGFDEETPFVRAARKQFPLWNRDNFAVRTDSDMAQLALIRAGCGIGVCQVNLAARDPNLVHVLPGSIPLSLETWLTMHEDLRHNPRCKVTFDALLLGLQDYMAE